jgi:hypothetical protein
MKISQLIELNTHSTLDPNSQQEFQDPSIPSPSASIGHRQPQLDLHASEDCSSSHVKFIGFKCPICHVTTNQDDIQSHVGQHFTRGIKCLRCSRLFRFKSHFVDHTISHCRKPFQCGSCKKCFYSHKKCEDHIHRPYKCPTCLKGFTSAADLNKHIRRSKGKVFFIS